MRFLVRQCRLLLAETQPRLSSADPRAPHGSGSQAPSRKLSVGRVPKDRKCALGVHQGYARTVRQNFNGPLASSSMGGARGPSNFAHCSYSRERSVELPAPPDQFQASSRFKAVANWDYPTFQLCFKFVSIVISAQLWANPASPSDETKLI